MPRWRATREKLSYARSKRPFVVIPDSPDGKPKYSNILYHDELEALPGEEPGELAGIAMSVVIRCFTGLVRLGGAYLRRSAFWPPALQSGLRVVTGHYTDECHTSIVPLT